MVKLCDEGQIVTFLGLGWLGFGFGYAFLGELYFARGQREKAKENLEKAKNEFKDMGMDYWLARTYVVYSDYYKKGEASKAKKNLNKAIEILKECEAAHLYPLLYRSV